MARRRFLFHQRKDVNYQKRVSFVRFVFIIFFLVLVSRLFSLQVTHHSDFTKQAEAIHETTAVLAPDRGLIYCQDKNNNQIPLAINKKYYTLYAVPKEIHDAQKISQELSQLIPLSYDEIYSHLNKPDDPYELLLKKINDDALISSEARNKVLPSEAKQVLINKIKEANLEGIYLTSENYRYYPLGSLASQTVGFVAESDDAKIKGRYGLELYYDEILSGESGVFQGVRDAFGRLIRSVFSQEKQVKEGADIVTTIDKNIQFISEQALTSLIKEREAANGSIIVMEAKSGKILALANYPTFDLNEFSKVKDFSIFRNIVIEDRYEPGSIIKPFTMTAGIDLGLVTPETTYIDKGYYNVGGYKIVNFNNQVYGESNMIKVLDKSINTGAIFVAEKLGLENLRKYFKTFGLNQRTGIDLPNEITGDLSNLEYPKANPTYLATASFGLGVAVSPIELIRAYAVIANKGIEINPYIVERIRDSQGEYSTNINPSENKGVLSSKTAETIISMLVDVVENGYGNNAKIKGYTIAGKTGTAFIALPGGKGYSDDEIHSFVSFFPAFDPEFIILVKMEKPKYPSSASHTVTLTAKEIEQFLINYYNIPPDENL